jgi:GIY-YIG catalytic domain
VTLREFTTLPNINLLERKALPECSVIYLAITGEQVLYIGLATNLRKRWQNHHRLPQLTAIGKRCEVRLYWLACPSEQLAELETQYIDYYCPAFNQSKVPNQPFVASNKMLSLSLKKLSDRLLCFGICPANNGQLRTLVLRYLAAPSEVRLATTTVRKTLRSINQRPDSLLRWTETTRRQVAAHWRTRCSGMEVHLLPCFEERIMHNASMTEIVRDRRFGMAMSIPEAEYKAMRQDVRVMPLRERLAIARSSKVGLQRFPLECGAQFFPISGVDILCLTDHQLRDAFGSYPSIQAQYPAISAINSDPIPLLRF